ncbi:MAG: SDR family oxidoreductase [Alphaproteobacteria bacterium]|nr:SDR family oxidoreductase [Alphaproteobacteria bacterium]
MDVRDKVVAVTGGGNGIGRALAMEAHRRGARAVVVADLDGDAAEACAGACGGRAWATDVGDDHAVGQFIEAAEAFAGPIDVYCSNAGIHRPGGIDTSAADWQTCWDVNVMSHAYATRRLATPMAERGGYFLITVSAAGLLSQIGSATYAVTKHAALAYAEWLSIAWGERGLGVSALCPQAVRTDMIADLQDGGVAGLDGVLEPEDVARAAFDGMVAGTFLILPHPNVAEYVRRKATDHDRWIRGMRRLQERFGEGGA